MSKQLSVRIDDELEKALENHKEEQEPYEPTDSDVVRAALREYLKGNSKTQPTMATAD